MSEPKFTPGPWKVDVTQPYFETPNMIKAGSFEILLTVPGCGEEHTTWEANAHLIAAAPEMYEALKAIESCLAPADNDSAAQKVRAAIAKAEGRP